MIHLIKSAKKCAAMQISRSRHTRGGLATKSRCIRSLDFDVPAGDSPWKNMVADEDRSSVSWQMQIALGHIDEIAGNKSLRDLLVRHFIENERIPDLAREYGINYGTARSIVSRARKELGFPRKRKSRLGPSE
ncbi:MAG: hypothetical protein R3E01_30890 [Pirellulaceae bacterium]